MQCLWLADALFAEQRKGVAWVEQKGTGSTPAQGLSLFLGVGGSGKCNRGENKNTTIHS